MSNDSPRVAPQGVWWHVYPLGFLGAERFALPDDASVSHRLRRLIPWLDYSVALGLQGWVLGPVFASGSHGYDTIDHFRIDPRLGDEQDLRDLFAAAHDRGLRIVLDGVFNHVGRGFSQFRRALAEGPHSPTASWFDLTWPDDGGHPIARAFEGHDQLVALNHDEPSVVDHVSAVMAYWADTGADGWRLDAAYAVPTRFWRRVIDRIKPGHPDLWLFGEVIHGDYPAFVAESGVDSVTQYELWKAIASSINDANFFELAHAIGRNDEFLRAFVPVTFLGNHDTTRIASKLTDPVFLPHCLAILFGIGGTPVVYAGDEQGYQGVKYEREGGDDEVRPPFPDGPEQFSDVGAPVAELHRKVISFRNARPWLSTGATEVLHLANEQIVFVTSSTTSSQRAAVGLNLADAEQILPLPPGDWAPVAGSGAPGPDGVFLPPKGWALLSDG